MPFFKGVIKKALRQDLNDIKSALNEDKSLETVSGFLLLVVSPAIGGWRYVCGCGERSGPTGRA
jgi:hypothetical protein